MTYPCDRSEISTDRARRIVIIMIMAIMSYGTSTSQNIVRTDPVLKKIDSLVDAGRLAVWSAEPDRGAVIARQASVLAEEAEDRIGIGRIERLRGEILQFKGDIPGSMRHFYNALDIAKREGHKFGVAGVLTNLAAISLDQKDVKKAKYYFSESLRLMTELNNTVGMAAGYINMGNVYDAEGNTEANVKNLTKAIELLSSVGDSLRLAVAYGNLAVAHYRKGDYHEALECRRKSHKCHVASKIPGAIYESLLDIGEMHYRIGNYDSARIYLDSGLAGCYRSDNRAGICAAYEYLYYLDSTMGRYQEAIYNKYMWIHMRDSLNAIKYNSDITRTEMQYEYRQQEALAQQELDRERLIRNTMVGGIATLFAFTVVFFRQRNKVKREKARSEELLLNILPAETAEELKATGTSVARQYDQVSVLFTDFVNFTGIAETLTPTELVAEVHRNFTAIDTIIEKHGLEKIKTIGDAYLAVCGLPHATEDHALHVVRAALEIVDYMTQHRGPFQIRIGINSGPVVAGIVGVKKFAYDIWGDTVNTASRMESSCEPGRVNISESTYQRVKDHFTCEYRGMIDVKGKGAVGMYYVLG